MKERGATLYFAILIMSILMAAVFSLGSLVLIQIQTIKGMGNSIIAYYAADTGAERVLDELYGGVFIDHYGPIDLDGSDYFYEVWVTRPVGGALTALPEDIDCTSEYYCIKSVGTYNNTRRAVEVSG
jgi:hypothetical protein